MHVYTNARVTHVAKVLHTDCITSAANPKGLAENPGARKQSSEDLEGFSRFSSER